ncbi:hypothetical protein WDV85_05425 [Pseudokineococcus sp. 5B2Z-1]|uniref:hypothetical protein n=1 Tax=Pseudokineococcus sp. 5B2Z-1 TaxID=3132744 RepID=UPI0030B0020D
MTDVQAPAPPTAGRPSARPRRRRRRRLGTGLVVVGLSATTVTAGLVTGVVGPSRLVEGNSWGVRVLDTAPGDPYADVDLRPDAVADVSNIYGSEYRVDVQRGGWLDVTASVRNDSPVPIRVTGVSSPFVDGGRLDVTADAQVTVPVDELGGSDAWRPLGDGVVVPPGLSWRFRVTGRLDAVCDHGSHDVPDAGSVSTDQPLDVDYTVLGVPRQATPTMSWTISLVGPFTLGC